MTDDDENCHAFTPGMPTAEQLEELLGLPLSEAERKARIDWAKATLAIMRGPHPLTGEIDPEHVEPAAGPWVRVEDGLPDDDADGEEMLVYCSDPRGPLIAQRWDRDWWEGGAKVHDVTHWARITPPRSAR